MKRQDFKILIACEFSDRVRGNFERLGFNCYSCDLQPNINPTAKHIQTDVLNIINEGWNAIISFPPCTHLATSGAVWFKQKKADGRQRRAIDFFLSIANAKCQHIAIENPRGIMGKHYKQPDQIIQPYFFGDEHTKTTCLWLKNLPKLIHYKQRDLFNDNITHVSPGEFFYWKDKKTGKQKKQPLWFYETSLDKKNRANLRSITFPGIAAAMAEQWGNFFIEKYNLF